MVLYGVINLKLLLANGPDAILRTLSCHVKSKLFESQPTENFEPYGVIRSYKLEAVAGKWSRCHPIGIDLSCYLHVFEAPAHGRF